MSSVKMEDKPECETEVIQAIPVTNESKRKRKRCLLLLLLLSLLATSSVIAGVLLSDLEEYDSQTGIEKSTESTSTYDFTSNSSHSPSTFTTAREKSADSTRTYDYTSNSQTGIEKSTESTSTYDFTSNSSHSPSTFTTAREKSADSTRTYGYTSNTFETAMTTVVPLSAQNVTIGSRGRAFIVVFMTNIEHSTKNIYVTSEHAIQLNMSTSLNLGLSLKNQIDRSMEILSQKKIVLPENIVLTPFKKEFKAILITTSDDVFVISHDKSVPPGASVGSTTHIPLHKLSSKYIVISTQPTSSWRSQFAVAALEENTSISITFKMKNNLRMIIDGNSYYSGYIFNLTLDKLQKYETAHSTDLSGTVIESSVPIAAFSGNDCNILDTRGACDHLIEQLPPVNSLDNTYIVPPNFDNRDTKIRITASENTSIVYKINGIMQTVALTKLQSMDTLITSNQACTIESRTPIIVTSFGLHSKLSNMGDPSMTIVPGIHQYLNYYKIVVPSGYVHNYVSIMIAMQSTNFFRINGNVISERDVVFRKSVSIQNTLYIVKTIKVGEGELTAYSSNGAPFGLMFAGTKDYEAYGFSGNSLLL